MIFTTLFTIVYADDNSINGTCPGEFIEEITGTTINASHTETGAVGGGGNDRYRMNFPVAGTLNISAVNSNTSRNENYYFYVSRDNCGNNDSNWNIVSAEYGKSHSSTVTVNAGDTIYVRLQSISSEPNNGRHSYALTLDFTVTSPPTTNICTGTRGLVGNYYNNTNFSDPIALSRIDNDINFYWENGSPGTGV